MVEEALEEADRLIAGDRAATHGHYPTQARRIGALWATILDLPEPIPARTVAAMMVCLKMARATAGRAHRDDWIDGAGYAALGAQIDDEATR